MPWIEVQAQPWGLFRRIASHLIITISITMPVVAIEGCCHGQLINIYRALPPEVELLIICGDFQAIRNEADFETISMPKKYRQLADFHRYYSGELQAPVLTVFIGGNHECSSYLQELKYGGWVAPNIYYLGDFGGLWYKGIHIGGLSGIYNRYSFVQNRLEDEKLPYDDSTVRSVYHVKPKDFLKMCLMDELDICLSHDWPVGIEKYGNEKWLVREKKWFKKDIDNGTLGSPLNKYLLRVLRPKYWFSGHLHVRFEAKVVWEDQPEQGQSTPESKRANENEIAIDMGESRKIDSGKGNSNEINTRRQVAHTTTPESSPAGFAPRKKPRPPHTTQFLALDKCLPRRKFLEVFSVEGHQGHPSCHHQGLWYDPRAIAINKVVEEYLRKHGHKFQQIDMARVARDPSTLHVVHELRRLVDIETAHYAKRPSSQLQVPTNFRQLAPTSETGGLVPVQYWPSNQTTAYCAGFGVPLPPWHEPGSKLKQ
ncbi:uncharacterized protein CANTADRAFT_45284 [Suhomyces tanzawaensis NRRL Y-17324]|uniref:Lariat debranching enzyme C-terminal domain-containing protein n=1 Tax=Suhomyces tanzawaensis NRRL Y-17324 TaxID=984487 RepID=A0A1E4SQX4_9ASCO|nr:uncharacterized protein CANTADRAFT_45284 [Suhomyces tanzawaensis NRRL Y-17324]ODV81904.1 hypothetical protein CANTADRAFT_45284 [Suhomyces tanzawaensis NRRL Y-17324]